TPSLSWSLAGLRKAWNAAKPEVAPWWSEVSKEAFNTGLDALARGLKNWAGSRTSKRAGRPVGFPRFKSRRRSTPSVRFTTGAIRVEPDRMHVVLPRLGRLKLHESARKPARRLEAGTARILSAIVRRDGLHKLTIRLAREHGTVVVEDLNVTGMLANRKLARHIADAGFAEIRRQLAYKSTWNGGRLLVADRWYPSSKTCSACGAVKTKLALSERVYECAACGLVIDRDRNAALNLAALAAEYDTAGSGPVAGRGADQKTHVRGQVAVKRQPGTTPVGQTGTALPQGRTIGHVLTKAH
uniref:RNA-guided endonuclease TnpB family protein n=1 Tax=Actinoplanes solisilvae TaxID=2486853 RepID=UPI00196A5251